MYILGNSETIILREMRQKNTHNVRVGVYLVVAIILALFFIPSVVSAMVTLQDLPTTSYSQNNGFGYGSSVTIFPVEVSPGEKVTVSITVSNTGDVEITYEIVLQVNDVVEDTQQLTVGAGTAEKVNFTLSKDTIGTHRVNIGDLSGSFVVREGAPSVINWWLVGGIIAIVVAVATTIWLSVIRQVD